MEFSIATLDRIQFDLLDIDHICKLSVWDRNKHISGLKDLFDPQLGLPAPGNKCFTCNASKKNNCPGHFGHHIFPIHLFNPQHLHVLQKILNKICPVCGQMRSEKGGKKEENSDLELPEDPEAAKNICKHCMGTDQCQKIIYPEIRFKMVKKEIEKEGVETIEMEADQNISILPSDYWEFVDKAVGADQFPRLSRPLLPIEALRILKKVKSDTIQKIGLITQPEACILRVLPVPPNCSRVTERTGDSMISLMDQKSRKLALILNKSLGKGNFGHEMRSIYAAQFEVCKLQVLVTDYYKMSKVVAEAEGKRSGLKSGPKWFKKNILGKRSNYSARCTLIGDPFISVAEIGIPRSIAESLTVQENVASFNIHKLQKTMPNELDSNSVHVLRGGCRFRVSGMHRGRLEIGDVVSRQVKEGDWVLANRSPSIHAHSLIALQTRIVEGPAFSINPLICAPFGADFDGDTLHVFSPQSFEAKAELVELMCVRRQLICPQAGQTLLGLSHDSLISAYLLLSNNFLFDKMQVQSLSCLISKAPIPAIVKAPNTTGPLWTGIQLYSTCLPQGIDYTNSSQTVIIKSGEIMQCGKEWSWLKNSQLGLIQAIVTECGSNEALLYLSNAQAVLLEWLSQFGMTVGLRDMYLSKSINCHKKMLDEVYAGVEDAKKSSLSFSRIMDSDRQRKLIYDGENLHTTDSLTSNKTEDLYKTKHSVTISGLQRVLLDIETVVIRHIDLSNPLLALVRSGSKGSLLKLVQQGGITGMQLLEGYKSINYPANSLIKSPFVKGLDSREFYVHALSSRSLSKGQGVVEPGKLFRDGMFSLRELYIAYDDSVRFRSGNIVIQFYYGEPEDSHNEEECLQASEAVGALAITAIIEPLYNISLDSGINYRFSPLNILKDSLSRGSTGKPRAVDQWGILRLSNDSTKRPSYFEKTALRVQDQLHGIKLHLLASKVLIEFQGFGGFDEQIILKKDARTCPWITHLQLSMVSLRRENLEIEKVGEILTKKFMKMQAFEIILKTSMNCNCWGENSSKEIFGPCLKVFLKFSSSEKIIDDLGYIKEVILPMLLQTVIKGSKNIQSTFIKWENQEPNFPFRANSKKYQAQNTCGELTLQVYTVPVHGHTRSWSLIKDACKGFMDMVDWKRSEPYSISEVFHVFGIEAGRNCLVERIKSAMKAMGRQIHTKHINLIADFMTSSGKVIPLTAAGLKLWSKEMSQYSPFTQGCFKDPKSVFLDASRRNLSDNLATIMSSLVWGRSIAGDGLGFFDLLSSKKFCTEKHEEVIDIISFLESNSDIINSASMLNYSDAMTYMDREDESSEDDLIFPPGFEPH